MSGSRCKAGAAVFRQGPRREGAAGLDVAKDRVRVSRTSTVRRGVYGIGGYTVGSAMLLVEAKYL